MCTPETSGRLSTGARRYDIWPDRLGNFRELQLVDSYLGDDEPIITHASYPNDPRNPIAERWSPVFSKFLQVHKYNTRSSSSSNFYRSYCRLNHHKNSFASIGAKIWNSIPTNLKKLPERTFKTKIHNLFFLNLQNQDNYADIDNLIYEIKKNTTLKYPIYIYNLFSLSTSISFGHKSLIFSKCCFLLFIFIYLLPVILCLNLFLFKYLHTCLPRIAFANCRQVYVCKYQLV